ncbi:MAG: hypothetical protein E7290_12590 [Lachnospiraceae bacterium]|nr:hypothetical protein [Lachnospiraceae bacterium]
MGTILNSGKAARKKYKEFERESKKSVIGWDVSDPKKRVPAIYSKQGVKLARKKASHVIGQSEIVIGQLKDDSKVKKDYLKQIEKCNTFLDETENLGL